MKLEHLIQAYNFNKVQANIKEEVQQEGDRAGVIEFYKGITASYLLDSEDIVTNLIIFCNCLAEQKDLGKQIEHTTKVIKVLQKTIELLANVSQLEANMILEKLGLFDNTFQQGKQIKHLEHSYQIKIINGLLCLSIKEND